MYKGKLQLALSRKELIIMLRILLEPEETACTTRTNPNYVQEEITGR